MAYGKPPLKDGLQPFLTAYQNRNNNFSYDKFVEIMRLDINSRQKAAIVRDLCKLKSTAQPYAWIRQWENENDNL